MNAAVDRARARARAAARLADAAHYAALAADASLAHGAVYWAEECERHAAMTEVNQ